MTINKIIMRKQQEINRAAAILRKKGDRISMAQAVVLEEKQTETLLFKKYVLSVGEDKKDDKFFFALRDAARFAAGALELEELIPDWDKYPVEEPFDTETMYNMITLPLQEFQDLMKTLHRLEQKVDMLCGKRIKNITYEQTPDSVEKDYITQDAAYKYIGCSKVTILSWTRKGLVKGYRKGNHVYYSKSELDTSTVVQNFRNLK